MEVDSRRYLKGLGTYFFGDSKELNSKVNVVDYRIFSAIEHLAGYGNLVLSNFYPELRNNTGIEDLVTMDVAYRDIKSILGFLGHVKRQRPTGVIGSVRDISNLARRVWKHLEN